MSEAPTHTIPECVIYDAAVHILADTLNMDIAEVPSASFDLDSMDALHAGWKFSVHFKKSAINFASLWSLLINNKNIDDVVSQVRLYIDTTLHT